jgi:hypothetical protein
MPYKDMKDRDTYPPYAQTEKAKKARAESNKARRMMLKEGKVSKGDGMDVHHKKPLSKGGKTTADNLAVVPASVNRTYKRNKDHSIK